MLRTRLTSSASKLNTEEEEVIKNNNLAKKNNILIIYSIEGKTDYYARKRLITQDKNKYNTHKYRLVVRIVSFDEDSRSKPFFFDIYPLMRMRK